MCPADYVVEKEQWSMENKTVGGAANRREFLINTGKQALWMAPTLTVLMSASSLPAKANGTYGGHTYTKKFKFFKKLKKFKKH